MKKSGHLRPGWTADQEDRFVEWQVRQCGFSEEDVQRILRDMRKWGFLGKVVAGPIKVSQ